MGKSHWQHGNALGSKNNNKNFLPKHHSGNTQRLFNKMIENIDESEILPGIPEFLRKIKEEGYLISLGSASKSGKMILEKIHLLEKFDAVVDGNLVELAKPNPQVFVKAAELLGIPCENCIVIEDAKAGIEAALAGNMKCIGVGEAKVLGDANLVVSSTDQLANVTLHIIRNFYVKKGRIMKAVIAIDSMKGSLSSIEAGKAVAEGITRAAPQTETVIRPLADGGEGTVEALVEGMGGILRTISVTGPLGEPVDCTYGIIEKTKTAVIEMSGAAGITLVPDEKKNPLYTTTYGVGEVIRDAIKNGCRRFLTGIGGSATNDGGVGMLQALGFGFLDKNKKQIPYGAIGLKTLETITDENILPELSKCEFQIACDVTNPLCGENGASAVYGPQKGATQKMIQDMDTWLLHYARLAKEDFKTADENYPGTGAAGGLGFAFLTFTNAVLESGINMVLTETQLETYINQADLVITGEGRLDGQTAMGKAPVGVAALAKKYGLPVVAFAGSVTKDAKECNQKGIDAFFPILREITTLEEAMQPENAKNNLADTAEQVFRLLKL